MKLVFFSDEYNELIEDYTLTKDQLRYTGTPKECIELEKIDTDRYSILAIVNNKLVTFFTLHKNDGVRPYSNNENAILLRAFSTDFRYQGQGYAKQAIQLLPEFSKKEFPYMNEIVLAVNIDNIPAQKLYKKCGFIDEGVRKNGKKGELIIMSFFL